MNNVSSAAIWSSATATSRREFLQLSAGVAVSLAGLQLAANAAEAPQSGQPPKAPWYRRTYRWGQTNITERDPARYDIGWWRQYWQRTHVQGVIINAGGIVAYYPSKFPLQHRAEFLGDRDLYGELAQAAHQDGLVVLARMDSNRTTAACFQAHPDWFARDAAGRPYRAGELYVTCVNSPYYDDYIPGILREIIEQTHPEGITDNSWSGLGRGSICFCDHCQRKFRQRTGQPIPRAKNWDDPVYRQWILWNYERRLEIWDLNNRTTRAAGGPDCLWIGMNSGSLSSQSASFRDYRAICHRAEIIMLDHQARNDAAGFQENTAAGKVIHELLGWDKLIPESMAMYQAGRPTFRVTSKPKAEARLWMLAGFAGGLQPWWHHVGAYHEDRRMYHTAEPLYAWHQANEEFLVRRQPVANIGLLWSQQNVDFYGRDHPEELVELPCRGMSQALLRARSPYVPVHADDLERDAANLALLILPNLAAMSDAQVDAVRRFVARGGNLLATGETGLFNEWGDPRPDFALGDLLGAHLAEGHHPVEASVRHRRATETAHSYLRLSPELRAQVDGPEVGDEPPIRGERHPVLRGFEETDLLPFGGVLEPLRLDPQTAVLLSFIPPFPIYPPETAWMRVPRTDWPGLVLRTLANGSRMAFLPADLDRRFGRDNLPDHGDLLANLIRWATSGPLPFSVEGPGLIDCQLYRQPSRLILHVINLTNAATWRAPVHELMPVGPLRVRVKLPGDVSGQRLRLLVANRGISAIVEATEATFELASVLDHEVVVIG